MFALPNDFEERVYAGVLGKIIGVYLGRPFEGWSHQRIEEELGEIWYYVHEKLGVPLIVTDDDISGTFTFVRAFPDNGNSYDVTAEQIGQTWLNYLIENKTVLWWGGMGTSTEHTAFLRLKAGVVPPESGSIERNGQVVAEQIGAQIFIDGWAMLCPGDPEKAAALALKAGGVSHDGEALFAAQVIAAMEALAFVESDLNVLLDSALTFIPRASVIYQLITDLRAWKLAEPRDWRKTLAKVQEKYGYDTYGGGCHVVPNHAVVILALLYGDDDFPKSLMIANTAGWDTDCNSGNVGCLLGIKNGLAGIDHGVDFRGPVADRMFLPTADPGRGITDAVRETYALVNTARAIQGMRPLAPNSGMQFHFALPGSVQGFIAEDSVEVRGTVTVENVVLGDLAEGAGVAADERALKLSYKGVAPGRAARVATATFYAPEALKLGGYGLAASPTLYSGQTVRARVVADDTNLTTASIRLYVRVYGKDDQPLSLYSPTTLLARGDNTNLSWLIPDTDGSPIFEIGIEIGGHSGQGAIYLDWLGWTGVPATTLGEPKGLGKGTGWRRAWVDATDRFEPWGRGADKAYRIVQNRGTGLLLQGSADWTSYSVTSTVMAHLAEEIGIIAAAQGLQRHIALVLTTEGNAQLRLTHDQSVTILAEAPIDWKLYHDYKLALSIFPDGRISGIVDSGSETQFLDGTVAPERARGSIGLLATVGNCHFSPVRIDPV